MENQIPNPIETQVIDRSHRLHKRSIILGIIILVLIIAAFFGWQYYKHWKAVDLQMRVEFQQVQQQEMQANLQAFLDQTQSASSTMTVAEQRQAMKVSLQEFLAATNASSSSSSVEAPDSAAVTATNQASLNQFLDQVKNGTEDNYQAWKKAQLNK